MKRLKALETLRHASNYGMSLNRLQESLKAPDPLDLERWGNEGGLPPPDQVLIEAEELLKKFHEMFPRRIER